jgi:hypothetical protein
MRRTEIVYPVALSLEPRHGLDTPDSTNGTNTARELRAKSIQGYNTDALEILFSVLHLTRPKTKERKIMTF